MSCSRWISPEKEGKGTCRDGFPVTTGCLPGQTGAGLAGKVHCIDEEWCGRMYFDNGGKPYTREGRQHATN